MSLDYTLESNPGSRSGRDAGCT